MAGFWADLCSQYLQNVQDLQPSPILIATETPSSGHNRQFGRMTLQTVVSHSVLGAVNWQHVTGGCNWQCVTGGV
jgi:hypothetical protein